MSKKNFDLWMNSVDDSILEEAATVPGTAKKKKYRSYAIIAAACLVFAITGLLLRHGLLSGTHPDTSPGITGTTVPSSKPQETKTPEKSIREEVFVKDGTDYTLLSCETPEATDISGTTTTTAEELSWYAGGLEILLCSTENNIWASWYDTTTGTQWCLMGDTSSLALLTTAKDLIEELGYNVAVAPETATDVTYNAFRINNLSVAETTFLLDDIRYNYRMAATYEIAEDFDDISGTGEFYDIQTSGEVGWCPARIYYNENGYGKIIWFDIVPGLLYSLSMETNASEDVLLSMAHTLFRPAQDEANW